MNTENLIGAARLWDDEALVRHGRHWTGSEEGRFFLSIESSQLGALERTVLSTHNRTAFLRALRDFLASAAKRGKGRSVWTRERARNVRVAFHNALRAGRGSRIGAGDTFLYCREKFLKEPHTRARIQVARDDAILRSYLAVLTKIRRSAGISQVTSKEKT